MAWASAYEEWFDAGVAYSDDQLAAFDRKAWALNHRDDCVEALAVLQRYTTLPDMAKPKWAEATCRLWRGRLQFFCIKAEVPAWDDDSLIPLPRSAEGKALTALATQLDCRAWAEGQATAMEAALRQYVTIVRSMPRPAKAVRSMDNKVVNAIVQQRDAVLKQLAELDSMVS